jgi:hypothetical protein
VVGKRLQLSAAQPAHFALPKSFKGTPMAMTKTAKKIGKVMGEYKSGKLHSGGTGKVVKNPKQAIAIALSEAKVKPKGKK